MKFLRNIGVLRVNPAEETGRDFFDADSDAVADRCESLRLGRGMGASRRPLVPWVLAALLCAACRWIVPAGPTPGEEDIPSLVVRWELRETGTEIRAEGDDVYLLKGGVLRALDARTGAPRWERRVLPAPAEFAELEISGESLILLDSDRVCLVDRKTGRTLRAFKLGEAPHVAFAWPLLLERSARNGPSTLIRVNERTGRVLARRAFSKGYCREGWDSCYTSGMFLLGQYDRDGNESSSSRLTALDASTLAVRWTRVYPWEYSFATLDGGLCLHKVDCEGAVTESFFPIDSRTGTMGSLPWLTRPVYEGSSPVNATLQAHSLNGEDFLQNFPPGAENPLWSTPLPGSVGAQRKTGDRVVLVCKPAWGHAVLVLLNAQTGEILLTASGLPPLKTMHVTGDTALFLGESGVTAVALDQFGPPERLLKTVDQRVDGILKRLGPDDAGESDLDERDVDDSVAELEKLGPEAAAALTGRLEGLAGFRLAAAVSALEHFRVRGIAGTLARKLVGTPTDPLGKRSDCVPARLIEALALLDGTEAVPALRAVLADGAREIHVRRCALAALGRIGTPDALAAVDGFLARNTPAPRQWWAPPTPPRPGRKGTPQVRVSAGEGRNLRVFQAEDACGLCYSVWAAWEEPGGRVEPARFTGLTGMFWAPPGRYPVMKGEKKREGHTPLYRASLDEHTLVLTQLPADVGWASRPLKDPEVIRVDLDTLDRDGDGDGLPDGFEESVRLDPDKADTDGDGVADAADFTPNGVRRDGFTDGETARREVFRQFFGAWEESARPPLLTFVADASGLDWPGWNGPLVTVDPGTVEGSCRRRLPGPVLGVFPDPGKEDARGALEPVSPKTGEEDNGLVLAPGFPKPEKVLRFSAYWSGGPLAGVGYAILAGKRGGKWYILDFRQTWVS